MLIAGAGKLELYGIVTLLIVEPVLFNTLGRLASKIIKLPILVNLPVKLVAILPTCNVQVMVELEKEPAKVKLLQVKLLVVILLLDNVGIEPLLAFIVEPWNVFGYVLLNKFELEPIFMFVSPGNGYRLFVN